jgi:hypothetical protein
MYTGSLSIKTANISKIVKNTKFSLLYANIPIQHSFGKQEEDRLVKLATATLES